MIINLTEKHDVVCMVDQFENFDSRDLGSLDDNEISEHLQTPYNGFIYSYVFFLRNKP